MLGARVTSHQPCSHLPISDTNESAQLYESMRSIPVDELINVAMDGGFNSRNDSLDPPHSSAILLH